jgi:hypothetical protein
MSRACGARSEGPATTYQRLRVWNSWRTGARPCRQRLLFRAFTDASEGDLSAGAFGKLGAPGERRRGGRVGGRPPCRIGDGAQDAGQLLQSLHPQDHLEALIGRGIPRRAVRRGLRRSGAVLAGAIVRPQAETALQPKQGTPECGARPGPADPDLRGGRALRPRSPAPPALSGSRDLSRPRNRRTASARPSAPRAQDGGPGSSGQGGGAVDAAGAETTPAEVGP